MSTAVNIGHAKHPVVFEEFFEQGQPEAISPFLTPSSREWGINLTLKSACLAAIFLAGAFILSYFPPFQALSSLLLATVYFLAGIPALIESIEDLLDFDINIDILMTLAAFSSVFIGSSMEGALLLVLFALSGSMEDAVTSKAKNAMSHLHKLSPTKATVIESDGMLIERSVKDIPLKTLILVKSGQVVPLDGIVKAGASSVNLVHLTGENFPIRKSEGDEVAAGSRNLEGSLTIEITKTSAESTLSSIIKMVTEAQESRPKLQRWFDSLSRAYAMAIILLSFLFALALPFLLGIPFFGNEGSIYRALAFMIAASPCALIIAIPIAYLSSLSAAAKKGILLKGGIILDALAKCKAIALDKTGTLTTGDLQFRGIESLAALSGSQISDRDALAVAFALEKNAVHPIAKAILAYTQENPCPIISITDFKAIPGDGLEAIAQLAAKALPVAIGRPEFVAAKLPKESQAILLAKAKGAKENGELIAVLLIGSHPFLLHFTDTIRPGMKEIVDTLQEKRKIDLFMLTGDHFESAKRVADELNIKNFKADLRPEDKLKAVAELSQERGLAMVGDGVNDAPSLARATVGIGMGKVGSQAAMDAADVVLLRDNIDLLDWLFQKAKKTKRIVAENLMIAILAIIIATIPALAGMIPLWLAVVLHEGGTVLVGLNALRLLR